LQFTELKKVKMIEGGVEKDNESSRKMMEKAGFAYSYTDEDGMLMYTLAIA
jgi:RimJ/RimL family protein N-acetyltransferase